MHATVRPFLISINPQPGTSVYLVSASCGAASARGELRLPRFYGRPEHALLDGQLLGQALFTAPIRQLLLASAREAAADEGRLRLQLQLSSPELSLLPWEWLSLGGEHPWRPALRDDYALVRSSQATAPTAPLAVERPLRILAVAARGEQHQLDALDALLAQRSDIELILVHDATAASLEAALARGPLPIVQIAAPVALTPNGGAQLLLGRAIESYNLASLLRIAQTRLLLLSGSQGEIGLGTPAALALATMLTGEGLPATVATGVGLAPELSARCAAATYAALADGLPVDLAVTAGRVAVFEADGGWGWPQLRVVPGSEQLFNLVTARRRATSEPAMRSNAIAPKPTRIPPPRPRANDRFPLVRGLVLAGGVLALLLLAWVLYQSAKLQPATALEQATIGMTTAEPIATATPEPRRGPLSIAPPMRYGNYLAAEGDTPASLAARFGSTADAIVAYNALLPGEMLRPGRPLTIPVYQAGDPLYYIEPVARGNPQQPRVALTFDIEIDDATLYAILDILERRGLKGTFFVTGRWVEAYPAAARAIVERGHEIANHSLTHPYFSQIGADGAVSELSQTEDAVRAATGTTSRPYFRFPYGDSTPAMLTLVGEQGYTAYHWSADDDAISGWIDRVTQHPEDAYGGILLMHGRSSTVAALPVWLDRLMGLGLRPTTLTETLR